ncbi:unnamed protein product [Blepharisma stoltei]|uniref:Calponin-homology (CH) domain-containing protein n=1 Tax=Blepharisma stoltei TaxID=1481888 RepID=A0AAU9J1X3_9CILI|nr:unnamed protein product [Blepharisma stoltei]
MSLASLGIFSTEHQMLIDWINTFPLPACPLVETLNDLRSGQVISEIIAYIEGKDHMEGILESNGLESDIWNWETILRKIKLWLPPEWQSVRAQEILDDQGVLFIIIKVISDRLRSGNLSGLKSSPVKREITLNITPQSRGKQSKQGKPPELNDLVPAIQPKIDITPTKRVIEKSPLSRRRSLGAVSPYRSVSHSLANLEKSNQSQKKIKKSRIREDDKQKILTWIISLQLLGKTATIYDLIDQMKSGCLLCDLINRLEGRNEPIKGIQRVAKSITSHLFNINKGLEYLRSLPKINSDHLWAAEEIHDGSEEAIFGILNDIKSLYLHKQIAKSSNASPQENPPRNLSSPKLTIKRGYSKSNLGQVSPKEQSLVVEQIKSPKLIKVTDEMKAKVIEWITALELENHLKFDKRQDRDNFRNGVLICELLSVIIRKKIKCNYTPRGESEIRENFSKALKIIEEQNEIPKWIDYYREDICVGKKDYLWPVFWYLMVTYRKIPPQHFETNDLPYDTIALKKLDLSLVAWLQSLGLINKNISSILEVASNMRNGVLLAELIELLFPHKDIDIIKHPKTDHAALGNIRKSLHILRNDADMSQRHTWKEKQINQGDLGTILGLLEDIHRFADGLPPRKGDNYYFDGPYLGVFKFSNPIIPEPQSLKHYGMNRGEGELKINNTKKVEFFDSQNSGLEKWIESLGVASPNLNKNTINEFRSGEILCEIIEKLERSPLNGLHSNPKTSAAALHNIRKALETLYKKPSFPSKYMFVDEDILKGDGNAIRSLLKDIKQVYHNRKTWWGEGLEHKKSNLFK